MMYPGEGSFASDASNAPQDSHDISPGLGRQAALPRSARADGGYSKGICVRQEELQEEERVDISEQKNYIPRPAVGSLPLSLLG